MNPVLIHIGMPKAASSSLQLGLLTACPLWAYVGSFSEQDPEGIRRNISKWERRACVALNYLITAEEIQYRKQDAANRRLFGRDAPQKLPLVISEEQITASHYFTSDTPYVDRGLIACRLKEILPNANILLIIRNQLTLLPSLFGQMQRHGSTTCRSFSQWVNMQLMREKEGIASALAIADYHGIYQRYVELFGNEKVTVVLFEDYIKGEVEMFRKVIAPLQLDWSEVKPFVRFDVFRNPRVTQIELKLLNIYKNYRNIGSLVPRSVRQWCLQASRRFAPVNDNMEEEKIASLAAYYKEGNTALMEKTGILLAGHGYPLLKNIGHRLG